MNILAKLLLVMLSSGAFADRGCEPLSSEFPELDDVQDQASRIGTKRAPDSPPRPRKCEDDVLSTRISDSYFVVMFAKRFEYAPLVNLSLDYYIEVEPRPYLVALKVAPNGGPATVEIQEHGKLLGAPIVVSRQELS